MGMINTLAYPDPAGTYPMAPPPINMPAPPPLMPEPTMQTDFGQTSPEMVTNAARRNESLSSIRAAATVERMQQQKNREATALDELINQNRAQPAMAQEPAQPQVLDEASWAAKFRPDLAKKKRISRHELAQASQQYDTYLKRTALDETINRGRGRDIPQNIEGQLGYSVLTGQPGDVIAGLREVSERVHPDPSKAPASTLDEMVVRRVGTMMAETGTIDPNDPIVSLYMQAKGRGGEGKKNIENLLAEQIEKGETSGPAFDLYKTRYDKPEKQPSAEDELKRGVMAETESGIEGPFTKAWQKMHPPAGSGKESSLIDRKLLGEGVEGIGGFGGLRSKIEKDPIGGYGELFQFTQTQGAMTRNPDEQQMIADLRRSMRPNAQQIAKSLKLKLDSLTDEAVGRLVASGQLGDGEAARELGYALLEAIPTKK